MLSFHRTGLPVVLWSTRGGQRWKGFNPATVGSGSSLAPLSTATEAGWERQTLSFSTNTIPNNPFLMKAWLLSQAPLSLVFPPALTVQMLQSVIIIRPNHTERRGLHRKHE